MNFFSRDGEKENRTRLRNILKKAKVENCPDGWEFKEFAIGGLCEVGFSNNNPNLLLVISSNGRGIIDCSTLQKVERDGNDEFDIDYSNLTCSGIGQLENEKIIISGLHGGGLPLTNSEGESLETMALDWPIVDIIFQPKWLSIYSERDAEKCYKIYSPDTMKTLGFSKTGNHFVIATSSELLIFKKKNV